MIDTSTWKEFRVGDILKVTRCTGIASKGKLSDGDIPYITRSAYNNGLSCFCGNKDKKTKGNCLTIGGEGFVAFYQKKDFVAGNNMSSLRNADLNEYQYLFLAGILNSYAFVYSYNNARIPDKINDEIIKLPATSDGQPDWDYMESYMKSVMEKSETSIENLRSTDDYRHKIDVSKWGTFAITDLFDLSLPSGDLQVKQVEDGDIPLITPSNYNNGLLQKISNKSKSTLYKAGDITVDMFGNAYYQEEDFFVTAHGHVNVLIPIKPVNCYVGCFIASTIQTMFSSKYSFTDMCTQKVLKSETVKLPITSTGEPDWDYMERYMRDIMTEAEQNVSALNM